MALVNTRKMFEMAYKNGYAIGAFNVNNMEITQGIIDAVAEEKAPVILQISRGAREYAKNSYLKAIINVVVEENPDIPVAINLDHGDTFETCKQFVDDGFTSVMIDGSHLPLKENIAITKQVVKYAHPRDVVVGERLPGFPLVMHGSSSVLREFVDLINKYGGNMPNAMGVPEEAVAKASKMAICKVNIDTDLRLALTAKIRQVFAEKPGEFDPRKYLGPARDAIKDMVRHKLHVLGCNGKAGECL